MSEVSTRRQGTGPEVLLVHGGATPETTWRGLEGLAAPWTLVIVYRRGYPPNPLCDALADALDARRVVCPGAGHFVAAAPAFPGELEAFLHTVAALRPRS